MRAGRVFGAQVDHGELRSWLEAASRERVLPFARKVEQPEFSVQPAEWPKSWPARPLLTRHARALTTSNTGHTL